MSSCSKRPTKLKLIVCQSVWVILVGGIFGSMAWLVSNLPKRPNGDAESSISSVDPRKFTKPTNSKSPNPLPKVIENENIAPEWCASGTEKKKKLPEPIFALFRDWISSSDDASGSIGTKENQAGLNLAKKRRVALKKLIQANPRLALQQIIPSTTRESLPAEICSEFAELVTGVGNLEVLHACFGPKEGYRQTIFRTIRMNDGRKYNVSAYGQRSIFQEKIGMSVLGAAIDGELALLDSPARVLGNEEATGSGLSPDQTYVEISGERLSFDSREDAQSYCRRVRKMETTGGKVLNYDLFQASGQTLSTTSYQYQILDVHLTWEQAKFVAEGLGGYLAQIDSDAERTTVAGLIGSAGAWIGGDSNYSVLMPDEKNATLSSQDTRPYVVEFPLLSPFANLSQDYNASPVKILVIPARYKDQDTALNGSSRGNFSPQTAEAIYREMEATRTFYLRESNGRSRLDYNTTGTVTLPEDKAFYDWTADNGGVFGYLPAHAMAAASKEGYDISGYDKFVFITTAAHKDYGGLGGGRFAHCPGWQSGVIIHELGHCFGLPHANQWVSFGESPISDDGFDIDYGNPMSVMGGSGHRESADDIAVEGAEESEAAASFTLWAKDIIFANDPEGFYRTGKVTTAATLRGCDIIEIEPNSTDSMITESPLALDDTEYSNFYRIYHHDYDLTDDYVSSLPLPQQKFLREKGIAPYGLREGTFLISIPSGFVLHDDFESNGSIDLSTRIYVPKFVGSGNDVNATLERLANGNFKLTIDDGGSGFCVEPSLVFSETNGTSLEVAIHKDWIGIDQNGTFSSTTLLEKAEWEANATKRALIWPEGFARGLRGIVAPSSPFGPDGANALEWNATTNQFVEIPSPGQYWVGFRREFSQRGLTLTLSNKLLDMTRETQEKYSDGALLIGRTYSDYGTDFHVTPVRHGGTYPMEYIDVVIHYKTDDNNSDPVVSLLLDRQSPSVGEVVSLSVSVEDDPDQDQEFAFAWFVNDVMLDQVQFLNKSSIRYGFDKVGFQKIRVEVSDMKGGMASIARTLEVGRPEKLNFSAIEGRVMGKEGKAVRGLRVVAQKALPTMHQITWESSEADNRVKRFHIDGKESPDLVFHRGQWHRFILDESLEDVGLSFNEDTDRHPAEIKAKMGLRLYLEKLGAGYATSPKVTINGLFDQTEQSRFILGPDWHENNATYLAGETPDSLVLKMPQIESILFPTKLSEVKLLHGGRGYENPGDYPTVVVDRNKTWHTYHPWIPQFVREANGSLSVNPDFNATVDRTDGNATLIDANITARIDGVGTIGITHRGDGYSGTPSIAVVGRGSDVNATGTLGGKKGVKNDELGSVSIGATGLGYDEDTTFAVATYPANPRAYWSFDDLLTRPTMVPRSPNWTTYVKPNLAHRWKFDELENNNSTFADSIGDSNLTQWNTGGAIEDKHYSVSGKHWGSLELNGTTTSDRLTTPMVDPSGGLTVSLWARTDVNQVGEKDLVSMSDGGVNDGFRLSVDLDKGDALAYARVGTTPSSPSLWSPGLPTLPIAMGVFNGGAWVHLALALTEQNGTSGTWSFYVNGNLIREGDTENMPTAKSIDIRNAFKGQIDELEIYTRGLSVAEIRELAGMYVLDSSGNDSHGVLVGGKEVSVVSGAGNSKVSHALDLNGSTYVDLFPSIGVMNSMPRGTITAWYKTNGKRDGNGAPADMTILSASDKDDNSSALRLMIRDTGQIGFSVKNDGAAAVDIYTEKVFRDEWHHLAVIVDDNGTEIYVDGNKKKILASTGSVDARGFFSDVQNIDSITLGRHFCSNPDQTEIFEGKLDEVYLFDRVLSAKELQYMIDEATLNTVVEATLVPSIDAVGTLKLINGGSGYREIPRLSFVGTHTGGDKGKAMAEASLVPTKLDDLAFVDFEGVPLVDANMSTDEHGMLAQFTTGFRVPPTITIELSPSIQDEDAAGKGLFFIPEVGGYEITNSGSGFLAGWTPADDKAFVISGRGCKPPVFEPLMEADPHHDGFFRIAGVRLKERGYGPYDNNTTYVLPQYGANGKVDYWYLDPLFITGGNLAGPTYPDGSSSSRYQGDSGTANYPRDTYPAKLKVNVADAADVTAGLASARGDIMSMEVVSGGKYTAGPPGPPNAQDIVGGVGYREAPVIDLSGLVLEHRLAVDPSKTVIHQVLDRVRLTDRGKGYRKPLEVSWHGGYFPEDNVSLVTYPHITGVEIGENGSISSISAEINASTNITNWENLVLSITGAGGTGASASIGLSWLGGPIIDGNESNVVTDWFGQAVGIFERNQTSTGFHYNGWNQLFAFDGNLTPDPLNDPPTQYTVEPFWDWIAIPESNVTSTWVDGLTVEGIQYYWDDTNGSLYRFVDTARTESNKTYFDGNGSVRQADGKLQITMDANGSGYNPPGDTNQSLSNGFVLGVDLNATLQATWDTPPDEPAIERNATFDVKLGGSLQSISPFAWGRGSGYVGPKVDLKGDGAGAILHAVVKGGRIEKIVVEDSGKGYNEANVSIVGGGGLDFDGKPFSEDSGNQLIEANCSALIKDGKIISVLVDDPGWGYFQPEIVVTGSGSGVEAVPVIGDYKIGNITVKDGILGVFIIDPGSGFTERPWLHEQPVVHVLDYTSGRSFDFMEASLRSSLVDNTGDRIGEITITDGGSYDKRDTLEGEITLNYPAGENETNATATPYFDRVLKELAIYDPTDRSLTIPGTNFLMLGVYGSDANGIPIKSISIEDRDGSKAVDVNSSFLERPEISFNQASDFNAILQSESASLVNVFGNGRDYNATRSHNYVDVYVGNDFPEESFYHLREYMGLSTGGRVLVKDAVPGSDWWNIFEWEANHHYAAGQVVLFPPRITGEPQIAYEATSTHFSGGSFPGIESGVWRDLTTDKDFIDGKAAVYTGSTWGYVSEGQETYTDSQGYYTFNDLEPGLYNLTVFHEDESLQTISYQVAGSRDAMTQTVALKGIPELVLEASGEKDGNCTLVWSQKTISEADVGSNATVLKGVGFGFGQKKPALMLLPDSQNTGQGTHDLNITLTVDGRLDLQVVSAAFHDRVDKYYLRYRASSSGVDFWVADWNSSGVTPNHLTISPDSAANAIEIPVFAITPGDLSKEFNATVWDTNSNIVPIAPITWSWVSDIPRDRNQSFPLKSSENNNSEIAVQNADGSLTLYSTLRKGRLLRVDVLDGGYGYSSDLNASELVFAGSSGKGAMARIAEVNGSGSITRIEVLDPGEGYFDGVLTLSVTESGGSGAFLLPVLGSGRITIRAQLDSNASIFAEANATAAALHVLDLNASWSWLDRYFDSFKPGEFNGTADDDSDGLTNQEELMLFTNPNWLDTDGDGLDDYKEFNATGTNPLLADTDSDGLTDYQELIQYNTNATKFDTDGDGWNDGLEVAYGLDPNKTATGTGYVSGTVYFHFHEKMTGKLYLTPLGLTGDKLTTPYQEFNLAQASYYFFNNLQTGNTKPYAFFAFIDLNENKTFDKGEPSGSYLGTWDGILTGNTPQINITVFDPAPEITILHPDTPKWNLLSPGDPFTDPGVFALDILDAGAVEGLILPVVRSGNATTVMDITDYNDTTGGTDWNVSVDAPPGIYHLIYSATDSSGSTGTATRILTIRDIVPPTISLTGSSFVTHEAATSFQDPGYSAYDSLDGNLTADVNVTVYPIVTEQEPIGTKLGSYSLRYSVSDSSGNAASSVTRTVKVVDTTPPQITLAGGSTVNVDRGSIWKPSYSAYDSLDGDLTENVTIDGLASLDLNQTGSHLLTYKVLDSSNNPAEANRTIYVADWNFTLAGKAMDGYLIGASVIFDIDDDGLHDLTAKVKTDQSGAFSIAFTNEEFALVDLNLNGVIDPEEGRIKVSGGIDSSTMKAFTGSYQADANSSVVTPLTTLVTALIDQNMSREKAKEKVTEALGVSPALDISNYDAIAAAAQGDSASASALAASARVANAIRQTAAFLDFVSDGNVSGQSSSSLLLSEVAKKIASGGLSPLGDANEMKTALDTIVIGSGYAGRVTDADILGAAQLSARADEMIVEACATIAVPHSLASELAKIQAVIEERVVSGYDNLWKGGTAATLSGSLTKELLSGLLLEEFPGVNVFPPVASNGETALPSDRHATGSVVFSVVASDADGDSIQYSITTGNSDADGDGKNAFSVNAQGQLLIDDADDLSNLSNGQAKIEILLSDGKGLYGSTAVTIRLGNSLALASSSVENLDKWMRSSWLGNFYSNGASWIYHESLGWLYIHTDITGYWLWSSSQNAWLWTSPEAHPYFFKYGAAWLYLDESGPSPRIYDYSSNLWMEL